MTKSFSLSAALAATLLLGACAKAPAPTADPAQLELALAALRQQKSESTGRLQEKVAAADRVASTVTKVAPGNLDPDVAAALLR